MLSKADVTKGDTQAGGKVHPGRFFHPALGRDTASTSARERCCMVPPDRNPDQPDPGPPLAAACRVGASKIVGVERNAA